MIVQCILIFLYSASFYYIWVINYHHFECRDCIWCLWFLVNWYTILNSNRITLILFKKYLWSHQYNEIDRITITLIFFYFLVHSRRRPWSWSWSISVCPIRLQSPSWRWWRMTAATMREHLLMHCWKKLA